MKTMIFLILIFISTVSFAATVDTINIYSRVMHLNHKCVVIKPDSYKKSSIRFPTVYLLHGYAGSFSDWIIKVPEIKNYADAYQLLIVCPDGGYSSWYFNSPTDSSMKYETYIGEEVPAYIDAHYQTIKNRKSRAITGLSMGGHGALFIAFRHQNFFGACGSMSGGMNLYDAHGNFDIAKRIGDTILHADNWKKYSMINVIDNFPNDSLAIIFDCGVDDFFYHGNRQLHEKMLRLKIPHDYIERPGNHSWDYWANSIEYQLLFFKKYFDRQKKNKKTL